MIASSDGLDRDDRSSSPVLVGANWYRFTASEHITHGEVESVSYIWPITGRGTIRSRGSEFSMDATVILRLPWRHDVDYRADEHDPFHVGTTHLVPAHSREAPVHARVAHVRNDPLLRTPTRRGDESEPPSLLSRLSPQGRRLAELNTYAVERFSRSAFSAELLGAFGVLITESAAECLRYRPAPPVSSPVLEVMTSYITSRLDQPVTIAQVAGAGSVSTSTAERVFQRSTGQSILAWRRNRQLELANELLLTTGLRVSEVAARAGFGDPTYFSRVFRSTFGVSPVRYRADRFRP